MITFEFKLIVRPLLGLLLLVTSLLVGGCATEDSGNMSSRPWNTPKGWENGLPGGLSEERR
jgi:hypothetical protein